MTARNSSSQFEIKGQASHHTQAELSTLSSHTVDQYVQDNDWEATLLTFLSEIEQQFSILNPKRFHRDPAQAVHQVAALVRHVDSFTASYSVNQLLIGDRLADARKLSAPFVTQAESLPKPSLRRGLLGLLGRASRPTVQARELARQLVTALPRVLEAYLMALANGFATGQAAAKWIETCSVFQRQLTKLVTVLTA